MLHNAQSDTSPAETDVRHASPAKGVPRPPNAEHDGSGAAENERQLEAAAGESDLAMRLLRERGQCAVIAE